MTLGDLSLGIWGWRTRSGLKSIRHSLLAAHHVLLAHGAVVPVIRKLVSCQSGVTLNLCPSEPASQSPWDIEANRSFDGFFNRWYLDPILVVAIQQTWSRSIRERESSTIIQRGFWTETWRPFPYN